MPRSNSAQRIRALHDAFTVPAGLARNPTTVSGPVLPVDDLADTAVAG
jgi:ATP-dependent DNA helicase RecQ